MISWGTGIDGYYKNMEDDLSELVDRKDKDLYKVINQFDFISVRGPYTKKALTTIGINSNKIFEIGDPALFYSETSTSPITNIDTKTILVNWGTSNNNIFGKDEIKLRNQIEIAIQILLNKGYKVVVYPIWVKDIPFVIDLANAFTDENFTVITEVFDADGINDLINQSFMTLNFKLHANILSAAMNRPFISLAYRGKCFDFCETINNVDYVLSTDDVHAGKIISLVEKIENNYDEIVNNFIEAKKKYLPKIERSFRAIYELLL